MATGRWTGQRPSQPGQRGRAGPVPARQPAAGGAGHAGGRHGDRGGRPLRRALLVEDVPGVGKTVLARTLAASLGPTSRGSRGTRTCCRPTSPGSRSTPRRPAAGSSGLARLRPTWCCSTSSTGPRADPVRLLESMEEQQVSVDGETWALPRRTWCWPPRTPSASSHFPLVESQLDRFPSPPRSATRRRHRDPAGTALRGPRGAVGIQPVCTVATGPGPSPSPARSTWPCRWPSSRGHQPGHPDAPPCGSGQPRASLSLVRSAQATPCSTAGTSSRGRRPGHGRGSLAHRLVTDGDEHVATRWWPRCWRPSRRPGRDGGRRGGPAPAPGPRASPDPGGRRPGGRLGHHPGGLGGHRPQQRRRLGPGPRGDPGRLPGRRPAAARLGHRRATVAVTAPARRHRRLAARAHRQPPASVRLRPLDPPGPDVLSGRTRSCTLSVVARRGVLTSCTVEVASPPPSPAVVDQAGGAGPAPPVLVAPAGASPTRPRWWSAAASGEDLRRVDARWASPGGSAPTAGRSAPLGALAGHRPQRVPHGARDGAAGQPPVTVEASCPLTPRRRPPGRAGPRHGGPAAGLGPVGGAHHRRGRRAALRAGGDAGRGRSAAGPGAAARRSAPRCGGPRSGAR